MGMLETRPKAREDTQKPTHGRQRPKQQPRNMGNLRASDSRRLKTSF